MFSPFSLFCSLIGRYRLFCLPSDHILIRLLHLPFHQICQRNIVHHTVDGIVQFFPEHHRNALIFPAAVGAVFYTVHRRKATLGQTQVYSSGFRFRE